MKQLTLTLNQVIDDQSVDLLLGELLSNGKIDVQGINKILSGTPVMVGNEDGAVLTLSFDSMTVQVTDLEFKNEQPN